MNKLVIIPARGGSKGIPGKNIKEFDGRPLIEYTIDTALKLVDKKDICVTTDDIKIANVAQKAGLTIPFIRPEYLADDNAGMNEVLIHAIEHYRKLGIHYDTIILLQPTSPFRTVKHVQDALTLFNFDLDMVVSVKEPESNPYYITMEDGNDGFLKKSFGQFYVRRQDCPKVYEYNGAIYIINVKSLMEKGVLKFTKRKKFLMDETSSLDLDNMKDWMYCEFLIEKKLIKE